MKNKDHLIDVTDTGHTTGFVKSMKRLMWMPLAVLFLLLSTTVGFAQDYENADFRVNYNPTNLGMDAVGQSDNEVTIQSKQGTLHDVKVTMDLPDGVEYVAGTITITDNNGGAGAYVIAEDDISDLNNPIFSILNTAADLNWDFGDYVTYTFTRKAGCGAVTFKENGGTIKDYVNIAYLNTAAGAGNSVDTGDTAGTYDLLAPSLSVETITAVNGIVGSFVHTRDLNDINTGNASLVEGEHIVDLGTSVSNYVLSYNGTDLVPDAASTATHLIYKYTMGVAPFDAATANEDGNGQFDPGEKLTFNERFELIDCDQVSIEHTAQWSCQSSNPVAATVLFGADNPNLGVSVLENHNNMCGTNHIRIQVTNNGVGAAAWAKDVMFNLGLGSNGNLAKTTYTTNPRWAFDDYDRRQVSNFIVNGVAFTPHDLPADIGSGTTFAMMPDTFNADPDGAGGLSDIDGDGFFDDILPGDSVVFEFDYILNPHDDCGIGQYYYMRWEHVYFDALTKNQCGVPQTTKGIDQGYRNFVRDYSNPTLLEQDTDIVEATPFEVAINPYLFSSFNHNDHDMLDGNADSEFIIEITVPTGVSLSGAPAGFTQSGNIITYSTTNLVSGRILRNDFPDDFARFPLVLDCAAYTAAYGQVSTFGITYKTTLKLKDGGGADCFVQDIHCGAFQDITQHSCNPPCDGPTTTKFDAHRISFGWTDNAMTTRVDETMAGIELDKYLAGDTMRIDTEGNMSTLSMDNLHFKFHYDTDANGGGADVIKFLSGTVYFHDDSAGTDTPVAAVPAPTVSSSGNTHTQDFDLSSAIPAGMTIDDSDTFFVALDYWFDVNSSENTDYHVFQNFRGEFYVIDGGGNELACLDYGDNAGYLRPTKEPGVASNWTMTNCSNQQINFYNSIYSGSGDIHPHEYRPLSYFESMDIKLPPGVVATSVFMSNNQGNQTAASGRLTYSQSGQILHVVRGAGYIDEEQVSTSYPYLAITVKGACAMQDGSNTHSVEHASWKMYAYGANTTLERTTPETGTLTFVKPSFIIQPLVSAIAQGYSPEVNLDVQVVNTSTGAGSNIDYTWVKVDMPASVQVTTAYDITGGAPGVALTVHTINGVTWVETGAVVSGASKDIRIKATYTDCNDMPVNFGLGWDCDAYPADYEAVAAACYDATTQITIQPAIATILQQITQQPAAAVSNCSPFDLTFEVTSAQPATLVDPYVMVSMENGTAALDINSAQMEYPAGSGNWEAVTPTIVGDSYKFVLNHTGYAQYSGVPGSGEVGAAVDVRTVNLQMNVQTTCEFVSNSSIAFQTYANRACGEPANGNGAKSLTDAIQISGLDQPYDAFPTILLPNAAAADGAHIDGCTTNETVTLQTHFSDIVGQGPTDTGNEDYGKVTLPAGVTYVPGSFTSTHATNTVTVISETPQEVIIQYPAHLHDGDETEFTIEIIPDNGVCAEDLAVKFINYIEQTPGIACAGSPACGTSVIATGDTERELDVLKANIVVDVTTPSTSVVSSTNSANSYALVLNLENTGAVDMDPGNAYDIYCADAAGLPTGAAIYSGTLTNAIAAGATGTENISFTAGSVCDAANGLVFKMELNATNCMCAETLVPIALTITPIDAQDDEFTTNQGASVTGNVLDDNGSGEDSLGVIATTVTSNTQPTNGVVTVNADGSFTYTPNATFGGPTDTFTYEITDADGNTSTATVTINVIPTPAPELEITKAITGVTGTGSAAGDVITYDLTVTNTGNVDMTNVVITDADATEANPGDFTIGNLAQGASVMVQANHTLTQAEIDNGSFSNQATASGDYSGTTYTDKSDDPNNPADVDTEGDGEPDDPTIHNIPAVTTMEVEKTATYVDVDGSGTYNVGDRIDYVIAVENTGNVTLTNVTVSDPDATITGTNPIASIAPGATENVTAEHVLTQADIDAGTFDNQATASTVYNGTSVTDKSDDPTDGTNTDTEGDGEPDDPTVTPMVQNPELTVTKAATVPANATVGDDVTYTIVVTNTGNVTVSNIQITDTNASPATVTVGTLAPDAVFNATVTHTITQADMNVGTFDNQATATGDDPSGNPVTDDSDDPSTAAVDDPTTVDIAANQEVSIVATLDDNDPSTSTTPSTLSVGDDVTYTLTVENTGNVDVTPNAPAGYTYVSGDTNSDGVINPGEVWNYTMTHTVDQSDVDAGQIDETITVTGTAANGDTASDVSDDPQDPTDVETDAVADGEGDDVTSTFIAQTPAIEVTKDDGVTGAQALAVGSVINYNIVVTNTGDVTLTNVVVTDANADGGTVTGSPIASIAPGASVTVTAAHTVTQDDMNAGSVENTAVATTTFNGTPVTDDSDDADGLEPGDNDPTTTVITQNPELTVTKDDGLTGSQVLAVGDVITYTIVVENTGDVTLTNVEVTDANATITAGNPIASLAPGATANVTATHTVTQSDIDTGTIENTAVAETFFNGTPITDDSDDADGILPGDEDPTTTQVTQSPELTVTKDDSMPANATVGDDITYTIVVENTGNVTLTNVTVTDANAVIGGNATIASLAPGATATLTATHTITLADMNAGTVDNTAVATGSDTNGNPVTDDSDDADGVLPGDNDPTTTDLTPNQNAELTATLTDNIVSDPGNPTTMNAGDNINYTLNVENTGNVSVTNPTVPAGYTPVLNGGNNVGDTNGDGIQDPGETWVYTSTHVLTQAEIDAGVLSTQVDVSGTAPNGNVTDTSDDPDTTADNDQTSTYFNLVSELDVIKADVMPLFIQVGQDITYTITVTNTGNTTINNITVTDANATITAGNPIASLVPGAHADVTAVHTITQDDMDAGFVSNTAQASGTNTAGDTVEDTSSNDPDTPDANDPTVSTLPQHPSILTVKREVNYVDNGLAGTSADDVIEYEISVENTGDVTIHNVTVTDLLVTNAGGTVIYDRGDTDNDGELDVDETWVFTASYTVTQADMDAGQVRNTATAYGIAPDGTPVNDVSDDDVLVGPTDNPTTTTLMQDPQVEITKVDVLPANVAVGQVITYNLVVTNTGNVTLSNVTVSDSNAIMNGVGSASVLEPGHSVTFTAVHEITQADMNAGTVSNQATVTGTDPNGTDITDLSDDTDEAADVDPEGDGEPDDVTVTDLTPFQETGIEVSLTDNLPTNASNPTNMNVGEVITYTASVINTGNVSVTPTTPAGYTPVEQGGVNVGDTNGDGVLDPGETWIYETTHTITQADIDLGTVTETVTFTGTAANGDVVSDVSDDPEDMTDVDTEGDNEPDDNTVTYIGQNPELTTTKAGTFVDANGDGMANVGEVITYTITVTNTGNVTITNTVVTDPNATILTGSPIATLAPGASATVTAEHVLTQADIDAGEVENQATATGEAPNGDPVTDISDDPSTLADNDATITTVPVHSEITMEKVGVFTDANGDGYAQPGEVITYTFEVTNAGNQTISNVSIDDAFLTAAGATYVSGDQNGNGLLDVGETWVYTGVHELTQSDIDAGNVDNQALVTAEDPEGNTLTDLSDDPNNPANVDVEGDNEPDDVTNTLVPQHPEIEITKTGHFNDENGNGLADVGETITYTFVVTNTGNVTLTDVTVTDVLVSVDGTAVILAPGDSDSSTFTATYIITKEDIRTGSVTNTAVAHGTDPQGNVITDDSDDPTVADSNPDTPTVIETFGIVITDIFTPNGDGTNDVWAIPGIQNFAHNNVKIYNRWGNLVYEKDHYIGDWNGISNGRMTLQQSKLLPVGTYYYVIDLGNGHEPFVGYLYLKK